jgi:hypothetical protein
LLPEPPQSVTRAGPLSRAPPLSLAGVRVIAGDDPGQPVALYRHRPAAIGGGPAALGYKQQL